MNVLTPLELHNLKNLLSDPWPLSVLSAKSGNCSQHPLHKGAPFLGACILYTALRGHTAATSLVKTQPRGVVIGTLEEGPKSRSRVFNLLALSGSDFSAKSRPVTLKQCCRSQNHRMVWVGKDLKRSSAFNSSSWIIYWLFCPQVSILLQGICQELYRLALLWYFAIPRS